jgi:integrase/recombinase XerD
MSTWPDADGKIIERHLAQLRLRHPSSPTTYRRVLHSFQEVAGRQASNATVVTRETLDTWLRERARVWARSTLLHDARIINRFLDYLVQEGFAVNNPIDELRAVYQARSDKAVLRALLSPDADRALEALRQFPAFSSVLGDFMRNHIALMRARGYRYQTQARWLWRFDRFLQGNPNLSDASVPVMLRHWASARLTATHALECENLSRVLDKALHRLDPATMLRRPDPRPRQQVAKRWRRPYIYSTEEIRRLLDIAQSYPSPRSPLRPASLYTMLVFAYCCGLRLGELARLDLGDVDLAAGTITIRETKFFKSRILPLADSALGALTDYLVMRRKAKAPQSPASGLFWHDHGNTRYTSQVISYYLVDILRCAGLKPAKGKIGPRVHDLRHAFVVNRILEWYRAGINPQDKLPFLATYLGHRDIHSTLVYITVTQDLLEQANQRFRRFGAHCLAVSEGVQP